MWIPGPACNGVVNQRRPNHHEDHTREHSTTLGNGANCESNTNVTVRQLGRETEEQHDLRDCREHALVDSKEKVWNLVACNGRCSQDITKANVFKISDVFAGGVRESQRVTPKEPLEGDYAGCHHRKPDQ